MPELFLMTIEEAANIERDYCSEHFPKRLARADRFVRHEDYLRCIGAGALIFGILGLEEKDLKESKYGKLSAPQSGKCFSISHSGDYILLAVDDREIGADVELIDPRHETLADRVCLPDERNWLHGRGADAFFAVWTLKESMMKLTGRGMTMDAQSFSVLPLIENGEMLFEGSRIYAKTLSLGSYRLSVCAENRLDDLALRTASAELLMH